MEYVGFIGYGNMGSMLVGGLVKTGRLDQSKIIVTRKDKSRLREIQEEWPGINVAVEASEIAKKAKYIFVSVKPLEFKNILDEIKPYIKSWHHIISTVGSVNIADIESFVHCRVTRLLPAVTSEVNEGVLLACHSETVEAEEAAFVEDLLKATGEINLIQEKDFGFASEFTSCGPGFFAAMFQELIEAGLRYCGSFTKEELVRLVLKTLYGTARLMLEKNMDFEAVISKVATKGGITEDGVNILKNRLPQVFDEVFGMTMKKREIVSEKVSREFAGL